MPDDYKTIIENSLLAALAKSDLDLLRSKFEMKDIALAKFFKSPISNWTTLIFLSPAYAQSLLKMQKGLRPKLG